MDITSLIIQLISGALGGNAANSAKDTGLGTAGQHHRRRARRRCRRPDPQCCCSASAAPPPPPALDIGTIVSAFATGGISGGLTALVIGYLKTKLA